MKICINLIILLLLVGCTHDESIHYQETIKSSASKTRSIEDAINIANDIINNIPSRSNNLKISSVHTILSDQSRATRPDTLIYAIDIENNGGFILIAAPKNIEPILAVIDEGSYEDPANLENEAYQVTLSQLKQIITVQAEIIPPSIPIGPLDPILKPHEYWDTLTTHQFFSGGKVEVAWNQRYPENIYAPNKIAGCVPVAIAQILTYLEYPKSINYTFPNCDITSENLNWNEIKKHKRSVRNLSENCADCKALNETHYTIGRLVREIGHVANAQYGHSATSATSIGTMDALLYFTDKIEYLYYSNPSELFNRLKSDGGISLIIASGFDSNKNLSAHAWVADDTNTTTKKITHYLYNLSTKSYDIVEQKYEEIKLIHYNWGWGGNCNGYFNISIYDSGKGANYDYKDLPNPSSFEFDNKEFFYIPVNN